MKVSIVDILIILLILLINFAVQNWNLNKSVDVFTDAGVYLYSAKLIAKGFIPYQDFFLGNSALLIYLGSFILKIVNFNIIAFNLAYIIWFLSALIPIYFITLNFTKDRLAALLSIILYSTFPELVQWDAHSFTLRQASLSFFAYSLFFIFVKKNQIAASFLLTLFALSLPTNLIISFVLLLSLISGELFFSKHSLEEAVLSYGKLLGMFILFTSLGYLLILLIPNGFNNIFGYQLGRPFVSFQYRLQIFKDSLTLNWPILVLGLLGSLVINQRTRLFGLFNIATVLIVVFIGSSFYSHYITIFAVSLAISAGFLIELIKPLTLKILTLLFILFTLFVSSFNYLKFHLIDKQNPDFFHTVNALKNTSDPLFTFEPIYGIYSGRELTFHYHAADMRYFRVLNTNLDHREYENILRISNTVLIELFMLSLLPQDILSEIRNNFILTYRDQTNSIYVRKN